jgi:hypothetical protein
LIVNAEDALDTFAIEQDYSHKIDGVNYKFNRFLEEEGPILGALEFTLEPDEPYQ